MNNDYDEVAYENYCRIISQVTITSLLTLTYTLLYFLHTILCPEYINPLKAIGDRSFRLCRQGRLCDVTRTRVTGIVPPKYSSIVPARINLRTADLN